MDKSLNSIAILLARKVLGNPNYPIPSGDPAITAKHIADLVEGIAQGLAAKQLALNPDFLKGKF